MSGEFDLYISGREYEYENLLVYFIYRYLLKAVFDCDVLTKVRFAAVSYVIIRQLDIAILSLNFSAALSSNFTAEFKCVIISSILKTPYFVYSNLF